MSSSTARPFLVATWLAFPGRAAAQDTGPVTAESMIEQQRAELAEVLARNDLGAIAR